VVLDLALVPPFGLEGAALALAAGVLVYRGSAAAQIVQWFQVQPLSRPVINVLAVAVCIVGGGLVIGRIVAGDRLPVAVITGLISVAVYGVVLVTRGRDLGIDIRLRAD